MNNEIKHYGVMGMKWGVRKEGKRRLAEAKRKRDQAIYNANSEHDLRRAKMQYKQDKANIKRETAKTMSMREAEIRAAEPAAIKATKGVLNTIGVVGLATAGSVLATKVVLGKAFLDVGSGLIDIFG